MTERRGSGRLTPIRLSEYERGSRLRGGMSEDASTPWRSSRLVAGRSCSTRRRRAPLIRTTRGAHDCTCVHCRNFIAVRDSEYPRPFTELLARLGISTDKEAEIYEIGPGDNANTRLYGGWYHFVGQIERNPGVEIAIAPTAAGKSVWRVDFCVSRDLALESLASSCSFNWNSGHR